MSSQVIENNAEIEVELGYPRSGADAEVRADLRITDNASSLTIVRVTLSAEQLVRLLNSTHIGPVPAWVLPPDLRSRLGLELQVASKPVPAAIQPKWDNSHNEAAVAWAEAERVAGGWDTASLTHHNTGWAAHFRRWVDPLTNN